MNRYRNVVVVVAAAWLASACGGSTQVASSTSTSAPPASIDAASPSTAPTTVPGSSAPTTAPTTASTTAPPTTAPPSTTNPPPTNPPPTVPSTTAAPTPQPVDGGATAFASVTGSIVEVDVVTGSIIRTVVEEFAEPGNVRYNMRLDAARGSVWFSEVFEDGRFSCDRSGGGFGRLDVGTGASELLGAGMRPEPSVDGGLVAYLASGVCLPDPDLPDTQVLSPPDRVVVRDLATGDERVFVSEPPPDAFDSPSAIQWTGFAPSGELYVLTENGRLRNIDLDGPGALKDHPVVVKAVEGLALAVTDDALISYVIGTEGSSDVYSVDLASGTPTLLASSGQFVAVGVSAEGRVLLTPSGDLTVEPGADVTVMEVGDGFVGDVDW